MVSADLLLASSLAVLVCSCAGAQPGPPTAEAQATETASPPASSKLLPTMTQLMAEPTPADRGHEHHPPSGSPLRPLPRLHRHLRSRDCPLIEPAPALFLATERGELVGRIAEGDLIRPQLSPDHRWLAFEAVRHGAGRTSKHRHPGHHQRRRSVARGWSGLRFRFLVPRQQAPRPVLQPGHLRLRPAGRRACPHRRLQRRRQRLHRPHVVAGRGIAADLLGDGVSPHPHYRLSTDCLDEPTTCPAEPEFFLHGIPEVAWSPSSDRIAFITFEESWGSPARTHLLETYPIPQRAQVMSMAC